MECWSSWSNGKRALGQTRGQKVPLTHIPLNDLRNPKDKHLQAPWKLETRDCFGGGWKSDPGKVRVGSKFVKHQNDSPVKPVHKHVVEVETANFSRLKTILNRLQNIYPIIHPRKKHVKFADYVVCIGCNNSNCANFNNIKEQNKVAAKSFCSSLKSRFLIRRATGIC